eukprot:1689220-Alexandrium_andersonii.AAC.1
MGVFSAPPQDLREEPRQCPEGSGGRGAAPCTPRAAGKRVDGGRPSRDSSVYSTGVLVAVFLKEGIAAQLTE